MAFVLSAGQRHETIAFEGLMERGAVRRAGRGRPKLRPRRISGDTRPTLAGRSVATYALGA